jgi:hypothetical protein
MRYCFSLIVSESGKFAARSDLFHSISFGKRIKSQSPAGLISIFSKTTWYCAILREHNKYNIPRNIPFLIVLL